MHDWVKIRRDMNRRERYLARMPDRSYTTFHEPTKAHPHGRWELKAFDADGGRLPHGDRVEVKTAWFLSLGQVIQAVDESEARRE
jgi:hypothetical protein